MRPRDFMPLREVAGGVFAGIQTVCHQCQQSCREDLLLYYNLQTARVPLAWTDRFCDAAKDVAKKQHPLRKQFLRLPLRT